MEPPQEAEVDFSEVFSFDRIGYNTRNLNYWCGLLLSARAPRRRGRRCGRDHTRDPHPVRRAAEFLSRS
eukprot:5202590-Prymnesium_polylepis.2